MEAITTVSAWDLVWAGIIVASKPLLYNVVGIRNGVNPSAYAVGLAGVALLHRTHYVQILRKYSAVSAGLSRGKDFSDIHTVVIFALGAYLIGFSCILLAVDQNAI